MITDEEIEKQLFATLDDALDGVNQSCCNPKIINIDRENGRVQIEFDMCIIEEYDFVGFEGY